MEVGIAGENEAARTQFKRRFVKRQGNHPDQEMRVLQGSAKCPTGNEGMKKLDETLKKQEQ